MANHSLPLPIPAAITPGERQFVTLQRLDELRLVLADSRSVEEVKQIRDRSEALRYAARAADAGMDIQNKCAEIRLRAERRAGELLSEMPKHEGGRPSENPLHDATSLPQSYAELGIEKTEAHRWQRIATVPEEVFEEHLREVVESGKELTTASVLNLAKELERDERRASILIKPTEPLRAVGMFPIVYADPPWRYEHNVTARRDIENHYPTMILDDIKRLGGEIPAADDAVLFLWATSPKLAECLEVMEAWGFTYRTCMVWVKDRIGMGYYARQQHELLLIGKRGALPVPDPSDRPASVFHAPRSEHSEKPDLVYELIERMYPGLRYVEMFARTARDGWAAWGNQAW